MNCNAILTAMHTYTKPVTSLAFLLLLSFINNSFAAGKDNRPHYEDDEVRMSIILRTRDQVKAFYQGREFPDDAVTVFATTCIITPVILNKKYETLWLELDNWEFNANDKAIPRITKDEWKKHWQQTGLAPSYQSTFRWTLMPEVRDLRMHENVGGIVAIKDLSRTFNLTATFKTGPDMKGEPKVIQFKDLTCL